MAVNKVVYDGKTLIDLTDTTATSETVKQGYEFYDNTGEKRVGTWQEEYPISIAKGGTNATTAEEARANLGAVSTEDLKQYLKLTGGVLSGNLEVNTGSSEPQIIAKRTIENVETAIYRNTTVFRS